MNNQTRTEAQHPLLRRIARLERALYAAEDRDDLPAIDRLEMQLADARDALRDLDDDAVVQQACHHATI